MPHLPASSQLWLERAEIDYIGPFVKAWAAFNAWYRHASNSRRDSDGLRYVKQQVNPVRSEIKPLIRPRQFDEQNRLIIDSEDALNFKLLIRNLHACLDNYHIEVTRDDLVERISFRTVYLSSGVNLPKKHSAYGIEYIVEKISGRWISTVRSEATPTNVRVRFEQDGYDVDELQNSQEYSSISLTQRSYLLGLYQSCNPRPFTDLLAGNSDPIVAGDIEFRCTDDQLFSGIIEIIYALRNALLHGELQPHDQAFEAYEQAFRIVMRFLKCLQN